MSKTRSLGLAMAGLLVASPVFAHQAGDLLVRTGLVVVDPQESSSHVLVDGNDLGGWEVGLDAEPQLGLTGTYMVSNHIGVGLLAATPFQHDIIAEGAVKGAGKLGETRHLPPTLTLQYFPMASSSPVQPYVGVGVNYTIFFDESTTDTLNTALGVDSTELDLDDSIGVAAEVGLDYQISDHLGLNLALWWIDIDTEATITTEVGGAAGPTGKVDVDIDPLVYMASISYRF